MHTLRDLIDSLEDLATDHGDDAQVRLALMGHRTHMEYPVQDVDAVHITGDDTEQPWQVDRTVVYLLAENSGDYLSHEARTVFRGD